MTELTKLWCYIEGDRKIFSVVISPGQPIADLKEDIYKQGSFVGCNPKDLILVKVRYIMISM
jgi:Crinkler effector protein N-terminal domain